MIHEAVTSHWSAQDDNTLLLLDCNLYPGIRIDVIHTDEFQTRSVPDFAFAQIDAVAAWSSRACAIVSEIA